METEVSWMLTIYGILQISNNNEHLNIISKRILSFYYFLQKKSDKMAYRNTQSSATKDFASSNPFYPVISGVNFNLQPYGVSIFL